MTHPAHAIVYLHLQTRARLQYTRIQSHNIIQAQEYMHHICIIRQSATTYMYVCESAIDISSYIHIYSPLLIYIPSTICYVPTQTPVRPHRRRTVTLLHLFRCGYIASMYSTALLTCLPDCGIWNSFCTTPYCIRTGLSPKPSAAAYPYRSHARITCRQIVQAHRWQTPFHPAHVQFFHRTVLHDLPTRAYRAHTVS